MQKNIKKIKKISFSEELPKQRKVEDLKKAVAFIPDIFDTEKGIAIFKYLCKVALENGYIIINAFQWDLTKMVDKVLTQEDLDMAYENAYDEMAKYWLKDKDNQFEAIFAFWDMDGNGHTVYYPQPNMLRFPWEKSRFVLDNELEPIYNPNNNGIITEHVIMRDKHFYKYISKKIKTFNL